MLHLVVAGAAGSAFGWSVFNNVWNPGALRPGIDYTISSSSNPNHATQGARFSWTFPAIAPAGVIPVHAYPALIYGSPPKHNGGIGAVFPVQVRDTASLTSGYNLSYGGGNTGYNVTYDIWLTSVPGRRIATIANELMIWLHKGDFAPAGTKIGTYRDADFSGTIY